MYYHNNKYNILLLNIYNHQHKTLYTILQLLIHKQVLKN